ncbi:MAG: YdbH domain-containing protein [Woeseiaceae bacterium]|nr:YdbH domain-containing protein [Woeseiaceae bacterium]
MAKRTPKIVVAVAIVVAVLLLIAAIVINRYRDSIALEVANAALSDNEMTVTDVSVSSIRADFVRFAEIVLQLPSGTVIRVEDISLPVRFLGFAGSTLHIDRVIVIPGDKDTGPLHLAASLQAYLAAPATMPGATVEVDEVLLPDMPTVRNLAWYADELNPTLRASIGNIDVFVTTTQDEDENYRASVRALTANDVEALMLGFEILPMDGGYSLRGKTVVLLEPLLPVLKALGAVPQDITSLVSTLNGTFETKLVANESLPVSVTTRQQLDTVLQLAYQATEETLVDVTVTESAPVAATFEYPSLDWTADIQNARLLASVAGFNALPVTLQDSHCESGLRCNTAVSVAIDQFDVGALSVERVMLTVDSMEFVSQDDNWNTRSIDARLALHGPSYAGWRFVPPAIVAEVAASNDKLSTSLHASTPEGGFAARIELSHDLASGSGTMTLDNAVLDFDILNLSEALDSWPYEFDVSSGHWTNNGALNWNISDSGLTYSGTTTHGVDSLAGQYGDIGFVGLNGELIMTLNSDADPALVPVSVAVELIDIGFPIEDLQGRFTLDINERAASVESLSMELLGGEVTVDPFLYELNADSNELLLRASHIQLPLMVGLADLDSVEISGSVSGEIPVTLKNGRVLIDKGHLQNDPPGGMIRYGSGGDAGVANDGSPLGIVTRTLRNFEYEVLTSEVNYSEEGDLQLQMRLTGINPDVDATQPVILNLGIENNVPQMLRSLQATRSIEDVLEKRLSR